MPMPPSDNEEADTQMCVHIKNSLEKGDRVVSVQIVDSGVIIIIAAMFHQLQSTYSGVEIWVAFCVGKHFRYLHISKICQNLGVSRARHCPSTMHSPVVISLHNSMVKERSLHGRHGNLTLVPHKHFIMH